MTRVAVLTPPGTGAIATLALVGPAAWDVVRGLFRPAGGKPLPDSPPPHRTWFGSLGDEVVVAVRQFDPEPWVEVHCHGGRQVVRWLLDQFVSAGCMAVTPHELTPKPTRDNGWSTDPRALEPLTKAPTLRTASILLDQYHGAFARAAADALAALDRNDPSAAAQLDALARFAPVGRHLVAPWRVAVAGAPNVGKSSLVNALAGYQRSVVAPVAGTTRDVVTVTVALDGWPVELADTAGLREGTESLEAEGIDRARQWLAGADLVVWVIDGSVPHPVWATDDDLLGRPVLLVVNKSDLPIGGPGQFDARGALCTSATTGVGVGAVATEVVRHLVPAAPDPGAAVPFTPALADAVGEARRLLAAGETGPARETLARCLPAP